MKFKQESIEEVRDRSDLKEVLEHFGVTFKNKQACCPFHNEKSASFHIIPGGRMYKCFGCGEAGDVFQYLAKKQGMEFIDAVQWLASRFNIVLEEDSEPGQKEDTKVEKESMKKVLVYAQKKYVTALKELDPKDKIIEYLNSRKLDSKVCTEWGIGFAPDKWKFITPQIVNLGYYQPALNMGMVKESNGSIYDFLRNRITFPIHDVNGNLIGIAGRLATGSDQPKYFNPSGSLVYQKGSTWYGLHKAKDAIRDQGKVYVVEGYIDVIMCHYAGIQNTVCACGTAVTDQQAKILLKWAKHIVLLLDGDNAGIKAADKLINLFLTYGAKVSIVELPDNKDPDEWIRSRLAPPKPDPKVDPIKKTIKPKKNGGDKVPKKTPGVRDKSKQDVPPVSS